MLYSRSNCPLCDDAKVLLFKHAVSQNLRLIEVDIEDDADLTARYGEQIPVVVIDGVERFRGRINEALLLRLLSAK